MMPRSFAPCLGLLGVVVVGDDAAGCGAGEGVAVADVVAGDAADDGSADAAFGEHGCGRCGAQESGGGGEQGFVGHRVFPG